MIIQNIVTVSEGNMTEMRRQRLVRSGCPVFKWSHKSQRLGSSMEYEVPSDIHMFAANCNLVKPPEEGASAVYLVEHISVILLGNTTPPDLSEYSGTVKSIAFCGHLVQVRTAFDMIAQLRICERVEFHLGNKTQLGVYTFEGVNSYFDIGVHPNVSSLHIVSSVSQNADGPSKEFKELILRQIQLVLEHGLRAFPELRRMTLDLPDDGVYLDTVKSYIPKWKLLKDTHSIEVRGGKISLAARVPNSKAGQEKKKTVVAAAAPSPSYSPEPPPVFRPDGSFNKSMEKDRGLPTPEPEPIPGPRLLVHGVDACRREAADAMMMAREQSPPEFDLFPIPDGFLNEQGTPVDVKPAQREPDDTKSARRSLQPTTPSAGSQPNINKPSSSKKSLFNLNRIVSSEYDEPELNPFATLPSRSDESERAGISRSPVSESTEQMSPISSDGRGLSPTGRESPHHSPHNPPYPQSQNKYSEAEMQNQEDIAVTAEEYERFQEKFDRRESLNNGVRPPKRPHRDSVRESAERRSRSPTPPPSREYRRRVTRALSPNEDAPSETSIVFLGVPESRLGLSLAEKMLKGCLPSWEGSLRMDMRIGKGKFGLRPIKVDLGSSEDVKVALAEYNTTPSFHTMPFKPISMKKFLTRAEQSRLHHMNKFHRREQKKRSRGAGSYGPSRFDDDEHKVDFIRRRRSQSRSRSRSRSRSSRGRGFSRE